LDDLFLDQNVLKGLWMKYHEFEGSLLMHQMIVKWTISTFLKTMTNLKLHFVFLYTTFKMHYFY